MKNAIKKSLTASALVIACGLSIPLSMAAQHGSTEDFLGRQVGETFHTAEQAVNSLNYLPPPPKAGSSAFKQDEAAYKDGYAMKDSARWKQATTDADLHISNVAKVFSGPLGVTISPETTPTLYHIFENLLVDTGDYATRAAKTHYMRQRPFVAFKHHTCQPVNEEAALKANGSYPSGHTAIGQNIGLILTQIRPERADQIMKRSYEFGQSRVICGAHWQSDVNAGRIVGAVEYARLQSIPAFRDAINKAQSEVEQQIKLSEADKS